MGILPMSEGLPQADNFSRPVKAPDHTVAVGGLMNWIEERCGPATPEVTRGSGVGGQKQRSIRKTKNLLGGRRKIRGKASTG
jgi:hypothetical protein